MAKISMGSLADLDGYWKVSHHGNVSLPTPGEKNPRVQIYFSKLRDQQSPAANKNYRPSNEIRHVNVPIGELMRLPLGIVIKDRKIAADPKRPLPFIEEKEIFSVNLSKENVELFSRHATFEDSENAIIPVNDRTPHPGCPTGSSHYVRVNINNDPYGLIIPCHEVFRFFYCTSSKMAKTLLSDKILDVDRYLINTEKSFINKATNIGLIWLRQWMANSDRFHLARMVLTRGAFEEAKKVFLRAAGREDQRYERQLVCLPPMDGEQKVECIGKWIESGGKKRFFVSRIISSDWSLPFERLYYGRDNDAEKVASKEEREELPDTKRGGKPGISDEGSPVGDLDDKPGDNSVKEIELSDEEFGARYPVMQKIRSPKVPKEIQKTKGSGKKRIYFMDGGTVVDGVADWENLAPAMISSLEELDNYRESVGDENVDVPCSVDAESKLAETFRLLGYAGKGKTADIQIKYLQVFREGFHYDRKRFNLMPTHLNGKQSVWFFLNAKKTLRRPILMVEISKGASKRYLIEYHKREDNKEISMLIIWAHDEYRVTKSILAKAVEGCMEYKSVSLRGMTILRHFCGHRLKHAPLDNIEGDQAKFEHLMNKVFAAKNDMEKLVDTN